jgi:hypothetical protein
MPPELRQRAVLDGIIARSLAIPSIDGLIVLGSFAQGQPDALSDLDLIAVAAPGQLVAAWNARQQLAGDVFLIWEQPPDLRGKVPPEIRWATWLTHDLVKVECGFAAPGSKELAEPFVVVAGPNSVADSFPKIGRELVQARAAQRNEDQKDFDPDAMTPEERLGWKLAELKQAARALLRGERDRA